MNILLVCACGSSTSLLMQNMKENLSADESNWNIEALSISEAKAKFGLYDYVLMAPQVKFQTNMGKELCKDIPQITIINVPSIDFGRCNGKAVLDLIRNDLKNK